MFEQFPYTNLHELNLDWILQKLKEAYSPDNPPDNMVLSVNGETGDVVLYQDAVIRFPDITEGTWNIHRLANGSSSGIQFLPEKAQRIEGTDRHDIYDEGNPPPYPVTSVNGQTGTVNIVIPVTSVNGETGAVILYRNAVTRLPDITEGTWNIYRVCNGIQRGIQFSADKAERIENTDRYAIYDAGNPPPYPVTSVNGETGAVTIPDVVTDLDAEILNIDTASEENYWGLVREVSNGTASIYLDTSNNTVKAYISFISDDDQTNVTLPLLTSADIPSSAGVVSINGKTGAVTLYGSEISTSPNGQTTVAQDLAANANSITQETNRATLAEGALRTDLGAEITRATGAENAEIARANAEEAKLQNAIAIIVDGDEAGQAVPAGGYAYIKNNTHGLTDGLYINSGSAAFPVTGGTADSTTFTAVSGGGLNSLNSNFANLSDSGDWTPNIPRATFTVVLGKYYRIGNLVHLYAAIDVTASQTGNAYIDMDNIPAFGKTKSYATGSWMDNNNDQSGQLVTSVNFNIWFTYQGTNHPLTDQVGHRIIFSIFYSLN